MLKIKDAKKPVHTRLEKVTEVAEAEVQCADDAVEQLYNRIRHLLPVERRRGLNHLTFLRALQYKIDNNCQWRDLPEGQFGNWDAVYQRFRRWITDGIFIQIEKALKEQDDSAQSVWLSFVSECIFIGRGLPKK